MTQKEETKEQASHRATLRQWLVVDYKVGTTTGEDRKAWMKAQLYIRLGRRITIQWKTTN